MRIAVVNNTVPFLRGGAEVLADALTERGIEAPPGGTPTHRFAVSDDAPRFLAVGGRFLGDRLAEAEVVDLSP